MTPGPGIKGGFEGGLYIADHFDGRGENFSQNAADDCSQLRPGGAGTSDACVRDLRRCDAGGGACLAHRLQKRLAGLHFSDANDVAWTGGCGGEQVRLIAHRAGGLGTAAVDSEKVGHEIIFSTEQVLAAVASSLASAATGL